MGKSVPELHTPESRETSDFSSEFILGKFVLIYSGANSSLNQLLFSLLGGGFDIFIHQLSLLAAASNAVLWSLPSWPPVKREVDCEI